MKKMLIITAPSGAGKTTIVRHLLNEFNHLAFSVSATTRRPRKGEIHGLHYYFLSKKEFQQKIKDQCFAEWEEVYPGKFYGTLKSELEQKWAKGKCIIFDIDVHGAINLKELYEVEALTIFIKPPSLAELVRRLENRDTENEKTMTERVKRAKKELEYEKKFEHVLINDDLTTALQQAEKLVQAYTFPPEF